MWGEKKINGIESLTVVLFSVMHTCTPTLFTYSPTSTQLQPQKNGRLVAWLNSWNTCLFILFTVPTQGFSLVCRRTSNTCNFNPITSRNSYHDDDDHHHLNIQQFFQFAFSFTVATTATIFAVVLCPIVQSANL